MIILFKRQVANESHDYAYGYRTSSITNRMLITLLLPESSAFFKPRKVRWQIAKTPQTTNRIFGFQAGGLVISSGTGMGSTISFKVDGPCHKFSGLQGYAFYPPPLNDGYFPTFS
jgi:hypothetical protein